MELLKTLIVTSEKAAIIAREIHKDKGLVQNLTEEKTFDANTRFKKDFKTAIDVIVQQMIKRDVGLKFPALRERIRGEENNLFYHEELGKNIMVEIKETVEETAKGWYEIFSMKPELADFVADIVHKSVSLEEVCTKVPEEDITIDLDDLYLWIDPIDGTNQFIDPTPSEKNELDVYHNGLKCVTILIGVHDAKGIPIMGVINQPFFEEGDVGEFNCHWGVCVKQGNSLMKICSLKKQLNDEVNRICISECETSELKKSLVEAGFSIFAPHCAGYKLLLVILGVADAYVLSQATTSYWDTCGPHAILKALGGNLVKLNRGKVEGKQPILYQPNDPCTKNVDGFVAYRDEHVFNRISVLWEGESQK